jgi:hypothetical protein
MERQWHDRSPYVNQSLFNPEWVYGVSQFSNCIEFADPYR